MKPGPCDARIPRFYFNRSTGACHPFDWGGCRRGSNNFDSLEECHGTCVLKEPPSE